MCGRYVQAASTELLVEHFGLDQVLAPRHEPDYNIAPRRDVYAVRERDGARVLDELRWGLIPSWAKDAKIGDRMINARAETILEKPAYKSLVQRKRCLLPADGFYEWQVVAGRKQKQPMFIHRRDGEPLAFAGLWDAWKDREDPDAPWVVSCVIITTAANTMMQPIHDRMPVILQDHAWERWLDGTEQDPARLVPLLRPAADDLLEAWPVSTSVNRPANNGPELTEPAPPETLFA